MKLVRTGPQRPPPDPLPHKEREGETRQRREIQPRTHPNSKGAKELRQSRQPSDPTGTSRQGQNIQTKLLEKS